MKHSTPLPLFAVLAIAASSPASGQDGETELDAAKRGAPAAETPPAADSAPAAAKTVRLANDDEARTSAAKNPGKPTHSLAVGRASSRSADSAIQTPGAPRDADAKDFDIGVFGYIRLLGSAIQSDPEVAFVGRNDGFRLLNARIGVEGRLGERFYLRISADGANDEREGANDVEGSLRFGLKDAFADIKFARELELRVGRFPVIFDIENFVSSIERGFIRRAIESRGVSPTEGFEQPGLGVARNLGIAVRAPRALTTGSFGLGYEIAAQNGNGEFDSTNDNDSLAYSATALATWRNRLLVFGSFRYNERTEGELPFRRTETDYETAFGAWLEVEGIRFAGQLIFRRTTFETTNAADESGYGGHAEVLVRIPRIDALRAGYRYAILDGSDRIPQNGVQEHTAGLTYELDEPQAAVKLNLTLPVEDEGRQLENARAEMLFEVRL